MHFMHSTHFLLHCIVQAFVQVAVAQVAVAQIAVAILFSLLFFSLLLFSLLLFSLLLMWPVAVAIPVVSWQCLLQSYQIGESFG